MDTSMVLQNLLLGGLLGVLGQGIRAIGGLKKLHDTTQESLKENEQFDPRRLWITLFMGFIAGGLGVVSQMDDTGKITINKDAIITLIGIGYAGVDFIEAFLSKYISSSTTGLNRQSDTTNDSISTWTKTNPIGVQNISFEPDEVPASPRMR